MKKQWISVKCGLSRDPKHRRQMANSIWLFMHMLDIADWETGVIYEWKDEAAAEQLDMQVRTLREQRRELDEQGYITCVQKQYGQEITIHNWTNPREYSGEVRNKKQGDKKASPEKQAQGYTQGYTQGDKKDVTPTLDSNNQINIGDKSPMPLEWQIATGQKEIVIPDQQEAKMKDCASLISMGFGINTQAAYSLAYSFLVSRNILIPEGKIKGQRKAVKEMLELNVLPAHIKQAVKDLTMKGMTITDLYSVSKTAIDLANKAATAPQDRSFAL